MAFSLFIQSHSAQPAAGQMKMVVRGNQRRSQTHWHEFESAGEERMWPCSLTHSHLQKTLRVNSKSHWLLCLAWSSDVFAPFWIWNAYWAAVVWGEHDAFELYNYSLMRRPCRQTLAVHPFIPAFLKAEHMRSHAGPLWVWVSVGAAVQQPWLFGIVCLFSQSVNIPEESPDCGRLTDSNVRSAFSITALTVESFTCTRLSFFCGLLLWKSQDSCGHLHVLWQGSESHPANKRNSNGLILCVCTL